MNHSQIKTNPFSSRFDWGRWRAALCVLLSCSKRRRRGNLEWRRLEAAERKRAQTRREERHSRCWRGTMEWALKRKKCKFECKRWRRDLGENGKERMAGGLGFGQGIEWVKNEGLHRIITYCCDDFIWPRPNGIGRGGRGVRGKGVGRV